MRRFMSRVFFQLLCIYFQLDQGPLLHHIYNLRKRPLPENQAQEQQAQETQASQDVHLRAY